MFSSSVPAHVAYALNGGAGHAVRTLIGSAEVTIVTDTVNGDYESEWMAFIGFLASEGLV